MDQLSIVFPFIRFFSVFTSFSTLYQKVPLGSDRLRTDKLIFVAVFTLAVFMIPAASIARSIALSIDGVTSRADTESIKGFALKGWRTVALES